VHKDTIAYNHGRGLLLKLGAAMDKVKLASRSRKGPWRIANVEVIRFAMPNTWLAEQGLHSLEKQWESVRYPNKANEAAVGV